MCMQSTKPTSMAAPAAVSSSMTFAPLMDRSFTMTGGWMASAATSSFIALSEIQRLLVLNSVNILSD